MNDIRVLIVDDHEFLRRGLKLVFETFEGIELVGEAGDGREALALIPAADPDVIVTDARMPVMDGLDLVQAMKEAHPELPAQIGRASCRERGENERRGG